MQSDVETRTRFEQSIESLIRKERRSAKKSLPPTIIRVHDHCEPAAKAAALAYLPADLVGYPATATHRCRFDLSFRRPSQSSLRVFLHGLPLHPPRHSFTRHCQLLHHSHWPHQPFHSSRCVTSRWSRARPSIGGRIKDGSRLP